MDVISEDSEPGSPSSRPQDSRIIKLNYSTLSHATPCRSQPSVIIFRPVSLVPLVACDNDMMA
ncbi:uncharacterized protein FOMMEDRAFT_138663 [Fomitiporia mediterranea MF3/22]|uniref:uncharacterized protein n=1 Tax=Fomitiporia mediterranea (strain MF3/22) TaxID=694068 RepID=UPI00044078D2|nr:uncharacterized protein FOMMEDRAFT_138663 [Fomitiporia mediterranea MF3/22]EJD06881.1 hypothetical protein FOMMEDRAFT_138663 [Fomitiporia mediterranea MF3/22]